MSASLQLPPRHSKVIFWTWVFVALVAGFDAAWMRVDGIGFPPQTLHLIGAASGFLFFLAIVYRHLRRNDPIWLAAHVVNQMVVGSCALATLSYLGLRLRYPLMDAQFIAWDQQMGFNWFAYIGWVNARPLAARILTYSYCATGPEILVILALLCFMKRFAAFHRFALGYLLGGLVTIVIATVWPALTPYIYYGANADTYPNLQVAKAIAYRDDFFAMRDHIMQVLPENFQGMVTFPSFHALLAVLAIFAAWSMSSRLLGAIILIINLLMLLSTPVDGAHYLVDSLTGMALGIVVALLAIWWVPQAYITEDVAAS